MIGISNPFQKLSLAHEYDYECPLFAIPFHPSESQRHRIKSYPDYLLNSKSQTNSFPPYHTPNLSSSFQIHNPP